MIIPESPLPVNIFLQIFSKCFSFVHVRVKQRHRNPRKSMTGCLGKPDPIIESEKRRLLHLPWELTKIFLTLSATPELHCCIYFENLLTVLFYRYARKRLDISRILWYNKGAAIQPHATGMQHLHGIRHKLRKQLLYTEGYIGFADEPRSGHTEAILKCQTAARWCKTATSQKG